MRDNESQEQYDDPPTPLRSTCAGGEALSQRAVQRILAAIRQIRYGTVQIVIHDGRIVQIDRTEKLRLR